MYITLNIWYLVEVNNGQLLREKVKPLLVTLTPHINVSIQVPVIWHWVPANVLEGAREAMNDKPSTHIPATHVGDLDGVPVSWLQPGPMLWPFKEWATWGRLSSLFFFYLCYSAFQIKRGGGEYWEYAFGPGAKMLVKVSATYCIRAPNFHTQL